MGYVEQAKLAIDANFLNQVRIAVMTAAVAVQGETTTGHDTIQFDKRQNLATQALNNVDGFLARFAWAVAQNTAIVLGAPVAIASSTNATPIAVTTGAVHGLSTGAPVAIAGHLVNTSAVGAWTATVTSTTAFTIPAVGVGVGAATGFVYKLPIDSDIQFQVNAVWDDMAGVRITD